MPEVDKPVDSRRSWARMRDAVLKPSRSQLVVGVLLALLGFASVTQVLTADDNTAFAGYREQDLIDVLNGLAGATQRAQGEIARLERSRQELQDSTSKRQAALEEVRAEVSTLGILAGTVPVTGPGLRVTITDKQGTVGVETFLDLIEELRSVGAEAIQINGTVRLVAESSFERSSAGLVVDGTVLKSPYVVDVIGEPSTLEGAVTFARGPRDEFEHDGAEVFVEQRTTVDVRAVRGQ